MILSAFVLITDGPDPILSPDFFPIYSCIFIMCIKSVFTTLLLLFSTYTCVYVYLNIYLCMKKNKLILSSYHVSGSRPYQLGALITLQIQTIRHSEVKPFCQSHTARKQWDQGLNSSLSDSRFYAFKGYTLLLANM